jgi:hypothetical protein
MMRRDGLAGSKIGKPKYRTECMLNLDSEKLDYNTQTYTRIPLSLSVLFFLLD